LQFYGQVVVDLAVAGSGVEGKQSFYCYWFLDILDLDK
jgi:hypothetical protein